MWVYKEIESIHPSLHGLTPVVVQCPSDSPFPLCTVLCHPAESVCPSDTILWLLSNHSLLGLPFLVRLSMIPNTTPFTSRLSSILQICPNRLSFLSMMSCTMFLVFPTRLRNSMFVIFFFFDASECARFSCSQLLSVRNRVIRFKYFSIYIDQSSLSLFLLELSLSMVLNINFPKGILMYWYILFLAKQSWLFGGHGKTKSLEWDRLMLHSFLGVWLNHV